MKLVGTVSECRNDKGLYTLTIRGLPIPISGISDAHAGLRTCVVGKPRWSSDKGSYFKVAKCWTTDKPDKNSVEVEGTIITIYPERKNERNRRSACLLVRQSRAPSSTVLVTALSSNIDDLHPDNLSIGMQIRIGGYISFHGKGLHVLYTRTLREGGIEDAG